MHFLLFATVHFAHLTNLQMDAKMKIRFGSAILIRYGKQ